MIYCFKCFASEGGCDHTFDVVCEMSEIIGLTPKCPKCRKKSTVFRDYENERVSPYDPTPKTLGALAEQNTSKMSKEKRQQLLEQQNWYLKKDYVGPKPTGTATNEEIVKQSDKKAKAKRKKEFPKKSK